jgi:predicted ATPase/class 3 adenylate cyclase
MTIVIPGYQLTETLNTGERTIVYRGVREHDHLPVILKVLKETYPSPRRIAWFKREYDLLKKFEDLEAVITPYEFLTYQNRLLITMESIGGQSLADLLKLRPLRIGEFFPIAITLVETLGHIHQRHVIHKDINSSNIIFNPKTSQVRLIDFGISSDLSQEKTSPSMSKELQGTLSFIAPEQTGRMNRAIDYRSDFYSLGVTFYELLTGELPFRTKDAMELVHAHIAQQPRPLYERKASVPPVLSDIVLKLMAKNAEDRYQSTFGIKADLETCWQQWKASGRIDLFPLARSDISSQFHIPQKLYGREQEIEHLLAVFERVRQGQAEMLLVAGYSGIGKTMLVQEVQKPMTREHGYFIAGKFDQLQRNIPYASLTQAFRSLIRQLLTESDERIARWKEQITAALGANAQVILDVLPELERIIGPQPAVPQLGPMESQNRFLLSFQNFIQVFTRPDHPLVLFLDDLQWADQSSLALLQSLITTLQQQHLFVIGAYRDNEVSEGHPLVLMLDEVRKSAGQVTTITLDPLPEKDVQQLLADTLHSSGEQVAPLAELVTARTGGNPFFLNEFLKSLYAEQLITFNQNQGLWEWDLPEIQRRDITDNVIELMADKVQKLPDETRQVLRLAACIGNQFDLYTLAVIYQKTQQETANDLWQALVEGLVFPLDENYNLVRLDVSGLTNEVSAHYRFAHDRVQQAVYSLIADEERQQVHLQVGNLLLENLTEAEQEQRIFDLVNQLNQGRSRLTSYEEQQRLARLNLLAAQKAKASAAYRPSFAYAQTGVEMLPPTAWEASYDLALTTHLEAGETAYLSGDYTQMAQFIETVLQQASNNIDRVQAHTIAIQAEGSKNQLLAALHASRRALALLGIEYPEQIAFEDALARLQQTQEMLAGRKIAELEDLPEMTDPDKLVAVALLEKVSAPAYMVDPLLYVLLTCDMVQLSVEHGNSPPSTVGYVDYGILLCSILGAIADGQEFGKLALRLVDKFNAKAFETIVLFIYNGLIRHWQDPLRYSLKPLMQGYQTGLETGFLMHGTLALALRHVNAYFAGEELVPLAQEMGKALESMRQLNQFMAFGVLEIYHQAVLNITAQSDDPLRMVGEHYDEDQRSAFYQETNNTTALCMLALNKLILLYLFEQYEQAVEQAEIATRYLNAVQGQSNVVVCLFFEALACLARCHTLSEAEQVPLLDKVQANLHQLETWAGHAPSNYAHKCELIKAERAYVQGDNVAAREHYDNAIEQAVENEYVNEEALANELAARFYLSRKQRHVARHYLRDAVYAYARWGAIAKVQQLEQKHQEMLGQMTYATMVRGTLTTFTTTTTTTRTTEHSVGVLDFMSILKASQTLSEDIHLERVLQNLMRIVIENAGAERGFLLLNKQGQWVIEASSEISRSDITVLQSLPVVAAGETPRLPLTLLNYVTNTLEHMVLHDALHAEEFAQDAYILAHQPRSVLCLPLLHQGKLQALLYLENNLAPGAFTPERLQLLDLLSSQAAISIENALLYSDQVELTRSYSRFVPIEYMKFLSKERIMDVELGDHVSKEMAVMFSDIRSFTTLSERMTPQENFDFINAYLKRVSPRIRDNDGFIVKFLGDGMMAVFPNGGDDAIRSGIQKLEQVSLFNLERQREDKPPVSVGVGIHVGHMMVGMIGEAQRMQGDAFSDTVNLTARIEGVTKYYGAALLITEDVLRSLEDPTRYQMRFLDRIIVQGRNDPIAIYEVLDGIPEPEMNRKLETQAYFEKGIRFYQAQQFADARFAFHEVLQHDPHDVAAVFYQQRIEQLIEQGVPQGWDGVMRISEK